MDRQVDLFVFDLAGTIVVDDDQVLCAFMATADVHDLEVDTARLRARMGWHKETVFATMLREQGRTADLAPTLARRFEREYAEILRRAPLRATTGALPTLKALADAGVKIAFNTGFSRSTADLVLVGIGLGHLPSVASDEVAAGRPAPDLIHRAMDLCAVADPLRVGVAGDTPADLAAATAARARFVIGVGCGTHRLTDLQAHPHTHLLPDLSTLASIVLSS